MGIYNCEDLQGNAAVTVQRKITVRDTTAPKITLKGGDEKIEAGFKYTDKGASAWDNLNRKITSKIVTRVYYKGKKVSKVNTFSSSQTNNFSCNKSSVIASLSRSASIFFSFESLISASTCSSFELISLSETSIFSDLAKAFRANFWRSFFSASPFEDSISDFTSSGVNIDLTSMPC